MPIPFEQLGHHSGMPCEVVEAAHVEDATGYACAESAIAQCGDCGVQMCALHSEVCGVCREVMCPMCLRLHSTSGVHSLRRPAASDRMSDQARTRTEGSKF